MKAARLPPLALAGLAALQTLAYYFWLPLGLGPHVMLEPWLLNRGWQIYSQLGDNHSPLMPFLMAAAQTLVRDELRAGKLVLVSLLLVTLVCVYILGRQLHSPRAGLLAAAIFTLLSPALKFGQLRYETFLTPLYLLAWICWFPGIQSSGRFLLAGLVLGLAALTKQNAILFIGLFLAAQAGLWLLTRRPLCDLVRATLLAGLGAVLPAVAAAALYAATKGDWAALFFWVFEFNDLELIQMLALAPTSSELVLLLAIFLPASAALVWGVLSARIRSKLIIPVILCLSGIVLSIPRFGFEHLQPGFSGVAIITAMGILDALSMLRRTWKKVLVAGLVAAWSLGIPAYLLSNPESPRYIHEYSRLPMLAAQVREQIGPNACPYLFPIDEANANLYYLLGCPPPGELWLFTAYPFYSRFDLPQQAKIALERASPQWVLYFPGRWDTETHNPGLTAYVRTHYKAKTTLIFDDSTLWLMERR